ncbi:fused response regulator/phosphatase [Hahella sp. CCB-MM4]|nr:fused response regulator/phosphatase [Hahella sp. CCB-MM4]
MVVTESPYKPEDTSTGSLKILIADDNHSDRLILQAIVKRQGHHVVTAVDGVDAVDKFSRENPDIILLDALMPRMDGFEAAKEIKQLSGEDLVPIIFLTSLSDAESLAKCLEAGGDDFLSKPYNPIILQAKINAFNRMRVMHRTLQMQRDQIADHNEHLVREQEVAKKVFDNVAHVGCLGARNIRHLLSPLSVFNGDVLLACQKPSGGMHVLLGDFTGHGLPAAIGAMPMAEIFYGMTTKGYALPDILREINIKLKTILPIGFFCCATMVDIEFGDKSIEIWSGGLPSGFLLQGGKLVKVASRHLPLGIRGSDSFDASTDRYEMHDGDRFYVWSDGIIEAANAENEFYGEERLQALVEQYIDSNELFYRIQQDVLAFAGDSGPGDDLTMAEITMMPEDQLGIHESEHSSASGWGPGKWEMSYRLTDESLARFDPIPLLLQIVMEVPGMRSFNGEIFTIISELYSNALDHGVLRLDSSLKNSSEGFARYYQLREQRCSQLKDASVLVNLTHNGTHQGGILTIRVEDSGQGFDWRKVRATQPCTNQYSGRGVALLKSLCRRVEYFEPGNIVEVEYEWRL